MSTDSNVTRVKDDYAEQIAGDLAANQAAQEQRRGELQRLQQEIGELEESEKVLLRMQDALGVAAAPTTARPAGRAAKRAAVPSARRAGASAGAGKSAGAKKATVTKAKAKATAKTASGAADAAPAAKAPRARKAADKAADKAVDKAADKASGDTAVKTEAGSPSWLELVTAVLAGGTEPRSAAEVAEAVSAAHPARTVQAGVVRNTLEQGVARGLLERSKQGRSVYYSPVVVPTPAEPQAALPQQA
ncbi:hypothetical protein B6R96_35800 [Streptomyces sp. Sge12]|uniref:hypothetical protein n=1 Tax=Streptomyces sp. Sge12 TaxID=1972846 RepID=UPI0009C226E8|nr:hypothetical protein [Streptomyces sp. Sge12]ARE78630.1 hypothetical protein B6R96_35800 [Streptomyces sp. Sge12]